MTGVSLEVLAKRVEACERCADLRAYCREVGRVKRKSYADQTYWAKPVPGFGDPQAAIVIVGLAPAAHGANRTGRMFTGDRSGDFLYAALHRAGLANQPLATSRDDGLKLRGVYITAPCRCAPPGNKPTPGNLSNCRSHLIDELVALKPVVAVCLGRIGWDALLATLKEMGEAIPTPKPKFGHGAAARVGSMEIRGCYHVSQQNTFTGRLTEGMIAGVLRAAMQVVNRE